MEKSEMKKAHKWWCAIGFAICVIAFLVYIIWFVWMFKFAKPYAKCDDNYAVWQREVFLSYEYEFRDGAKIIEDRLTTWDLRDYQPMDEHNCVVVLHGG